MACLGHEVHLTAREDRRHALAEAARVLKPGGSLLAFASAYFHLPDELCAEIEASALTCEAVLGVMGPAWLVPDLNAAWPEPQKREALMEMARMLEHEPVLGPRIMAVARK